MNNIVLVNLTRYNSTKDMCRFSKAENIKDDKKLIILYYKGGGGVLTHLLKS